MSWFSWHTSSVSQYVSESDSGTCEPPWGAAPSCPPVGVVGKHVGTYAAGALVLALQQPSYPYPRLLKQPLTEGARFGVPQAGRARGWSALTRLATLAPCAVPAGPNGMRWGARATGATSGQPKASPT